MSEREREGGLLFSLAGQMKESGEKAKGISLTPQLPGWGVGGRGKGAGAGEGGVAAAQGLFPLSDRRGRTRTAEATEAPTLCRLCLPPLSLSLCVRPHDTTPPHSNQREPSIHRHATTVPCSCGSQIRLKTLQ